MDSGTGNVKITHHVKFLQTKFPLLKIGDTSAHHHSFILVPNETETLPIKINAILNDLNIQSEDEISQENLRNPSIEEPPLIQTQQHAVKGYLCVPENESAPQNEILGDVGDSRNILTHQRQQKHHENLADHLSLDPRTYREAINRSDSQEWQNTIKVELTNMTTHNVWSPARTDQIIKPLSTTWVFKRKTNEDGNLSKYKARLCVKGFNQKEGIDYLEVRPLSAPLPSNYKELKNSEGKPVKPPPFNFRTAVGLLQYLVQRTQPDLSFATSFLSQFLEDPKDEHYKAVVHTLKYLSGTRQFTLDLGKNLMIHSDFQIYGYTDFDWGGGTEKKSFSGSLVYFHGILGWRAHKQKVVALSSAKAKYNTSTESAQDLSWIKQLIYESTNKEVSCILHSDNQSAISIASDPTYHHRTRHIDF
ncbi:hypothetical protein O181_045655 [Austropuccinia psidii MF-1]|uniref:Reverse transcriptase Ty1/copia-type domain-containing protein n=1 Tax=Austropuccinia psidii MF-1 TaxID=1389203 RepID=A0A9Q3DRT8_9BASI|nr:hypothetical protein [Austropuccinia psidii MF-1]